MENSRFKFRAWEKNRKEIIHVHSIDFEKKIINTGSAWRFFSEIELMQYTGLKDRNSKEIYESDIIRWHDVVTADYPVTFTDGVFCLDDSPSENFYHHGEEIGAKWEVIGNIYENKDLLEGIK